MHVYSIQVRFLITKFATLGNTCMWLDSFSFSGNIILLPLVQTKISYYLTIVWPDNNNRSSTYLKDVTSIWINVQWLLVCLLYISTYGTRDTLTKIWLNDACKLISSCHFIFLVRLVHNQLIPLLTLVSTYFQNS